MRISAELRDHEAARWPAEALPCRGWLEDGRTCLTRSGEPIAAGRLVPAVVDGHSPEPIDRVPGRWPRPLSGLDPDTRLHFCLLRRPASPGAANDGAPGIVAFSRHTCRAFLSGRVQRLEACLVWPHGPRPGPAADAGRALVPEHTPIEIHPPAGASRFLSARVNRPGTMPDGATGSGMNGRLALSGLEDGRTHLRLEADPDSDRLCTSSPLDAEQRARASERHRLARALERPPSTSRPTHSTRT